MFKILVVIASTTRSAATMAVSAVMLTTVMPVAMIAATSAMSIAPPMLTIAGMSIAAMVVSVFFIFVPVKFFIVHFYSSYKRKSLKLLLTARLNSLMPFFLVY
jgi:hypothetical protein